MGDLGNFIKRIDGMAARIPQNVNHLKIELAVAIDQGLVTGTAVDTGRARSNWLPSRSTARDQVIEPYSPIPQKKDPSKLGETANAAAAMQAARDEFSTAAPGEPLYLQNNVSYIERIMYEYWSPQTQPGYVQKVIAEALEEVLTFNVNVTGGTP